MGRSPLLLLAALLIPAVLTSCGERAEGPTPHAILREYRNGPLYVRLSTDRDSVSVAQSVALTLEAEVEEGFEAELPKLEEKLGGFGIRDRRDEPPRLTRQGRIASRTTCTLDPFLPGDYTVPPLLVRWRKDVGDGSAPREQEIATEALTIRVHSLLEGKEPVLKPIKGPVALPSQPLSLWIVLLGAAALAALFLLWRRRAASRQHAAPPIPAHELAYRQLQDILAEGLVERGDVKRFFSKVSDVLRGYIENRFGLQAPRRTTEEFLSDIGREAPFSAAQRGLLMEFLRDCDLVKFAEHTPSQEEIARAVATCRAFIDTTKVHPPEDNGRHAS